MGNINSKSKYNKTTKKIGLAMSVILTIGIIYLGLLFTFVNSSSIDSLDIILFIKVFELMLGAVAIASCVLCYNSTKKEEIFIVSLMYIVLFIDILLGNVDNVSFDYKKMNMESYLTIATSLLRIIILLVSISNKSKIKEAILNNKFKSIYIVTGLSILLGLLENKGIIANVIENDTYFILYNSFLILIYFIVCVSYLVKGLKSKEYIYSVISSSIFFLMIKAIYAIVGVVAASPSIKLLSISITYIGFIVLICGIIFELLSTLKRNKDLEKELMIFKEIVDNSKLSSIIMYNEDDDITYYNNTLKEYLNIKDGDTLEHVKEIFEGELKYIDDEIVKTINEHVLQLGYWRGSIEIPSKERTYSLSIQKIYMDGDRNTVVIFNDISEKIRVEKYLVEYEKMKNQEEIRNEFFANISHELRTPLNIFYSTVQLLDIKCENTKEDFKETYIKHKQCLKTNCQRMLRLINNIVDVTKLDIGFIKPKFENIEIVRVVEDITLSVLNYAQYKNIKILFDTEVEEHVIRCDKDMIERVMLNLLSNSIKFTKPNGNIWVDMYVDEKWTHIRVKDDGIGIPLDVQDVIFERFIQSDKSLTRLNEGSGIGLSLVKSAIKLNEGEIYLDSDGEHGTEFEILLPNKIIEGKEINLDYEVNTSNIELELSDIYELYT